MDSGLIGPFLQQQEVGADTVFVDLDNAVDHELAGVSGATPNRLSLDVIQHDPEQSLLLVACRCR